LSRGEAPADVAAAAAAPSFSSAAIRGDDYRQLLHTVVSNAPIAFWAVDTQGTITLSEGSGLRGLDLAPGEVVGESVFELYGDHPRIPELIRRTLAGEVITTVVELEGVVFDSWMAPLRDREGRIVGAHGVATDITQWRRAERELQQAREELEANVLQRTVQLVEANARLQAEFAQRQRAEEDLRQQARVLQSILDNTPAVIYMKDPQGQYLLINRSYETLFHISRDEIMGRTDYEVFPKEAADRFRENDLRVLAAGEPIQFEEVAPHDDGFHTYVSVKFPLHDAAGAPYAVCGISTDITDRKRAELQLLAEQRFMRQLLRAHERDRQLTAYEIHDGMIQDITGALMQLESLAADETRARADGLPARLDAALATLRRSLAEGRRLLSGLRPPILDEQGVVMAVRYLIAEPTADGDLHVDFEVDVSFDRLDPLLEATVFRVVQEALTNVRRHSRAAKAQVKLLQRGRVLEVTVRDWGIGFDTSHDYENRFGVEGIRKRAMVVGGRVEIESKLGQGTRVYVEFPLGTSTPGDGSAPDSLAEVPRP
jgi:PAS domain S-box-containing protein